MGEAARSRTEYTLVLCFVFLIPEGHDEGLVFNFVHLLNSRMTELACFISSASAGIQLFADHDCNEHENRNKGREAAGRYI